ncbi:MAG TPA: glycosyltransferase [Longimicrobiales bacterium]|nr:glycosyltransferase [Longimicrobiales bacterium]
MKKATKDIPRVSILLPCRDAEAYLPDTIASVEAQTFTSAEIVAVDDGSTDGTRSLLHAWALRDPHVRVLSQERLGIIPALQRAVAAARGEIFVRMDADDIAYSSRIQKQVELLDANPDVDVCGTLIRYFPRQDVQGGAQRYETWINSLVDHDSITRDIFVECPIAHPTMAVRREAFEKAGGYQDNGWPEDYDLVMRLWISGAKMAKVPEVLLRWRERPDRASRLEERYSEDAFRRCKVHYLKKTLLAKREVVVWGAGPVGKAFAQELQRQKVPVRAFVDLDVRKIGQTIHGAAVVDPTALEAHRDALTVAAVGQLLARDEIRRTLLEAQLREGVDFVAVA